LSTVIVSMQSAKNPESFKPAEDGRERRPRPRIESLADLIFGLSLAIDSIALLPISAITPDEMNKRILIFAFAFLFLITAWMIYTTYMSVLPIDSLAVTFLNVALLLLVALIPYLLNNVIGDPGIRDYSSSLFALDLTGILVILAFFAHIISVEENRIVAPELARLFRNGRNRMAALAILTAISVAPIFWERDVLGLKVRILIWTFPLISYWVGRALRPQSRSYRLA
jgi:uncharacterized membrane protein